LVPWAHPSLLPKRHVDRFIRFCTAHCSVPFHYFTTGRYVSSKNCPSPWGIGSPSNTWYLGPTRVIIPNGNSISSAVFVLVPNATLYNALSMVKKTPKLAPSHWDFVTPPEEDRASVTGNMHKKLVKIAMWFGRYPRGQTDIHTDRHAHHSTSLLLL